MESQVSSPKRRILYVITKGNWGGAQRYVYDLATALPKDEFEVSVAFGQPGKLAERLKEVGITTHEVRSLQRDVSFGTDIRSFFELRRLLKTVRPDIVHLNSSKAGGVGALAARAAGVQNIIFTAHGWPFWESRNILVRSIIWLFSWLTALISHTIIVVSDYDLGVAKKMPFVSHKVVRIYNGISADIVLDSGESIRKAFPPGVRITGTVGELTKNKNQRALIETARKDPTLNVAIVGEGEERAALETLIQKYNLGERVKLFGFMPAREVMKGFDVFALPSLKEGLPYVLLEAKAAGLPIVANRVGGVGEALDKPLNAFSLEQMLEKTFKQYRSRR